MIKRSVEEIIKEYGDMVFKIALHHVEYHQAQDIVQEVMFKYVKRMIGFHTIEHEKAWIIRVTINQCKDYHKKWWNKNRDEIDYDNIIIPDNHETYALLDIIKDLPFQYKNTLYLYYYEGMSIKEIAKIQNVKESTVNSWLYRGREKLKKLLEEDCDG